MPYKDKEKQRVYLRNYLRKRRKEQHEWYYGLKKAVKCIKCGESDYRCLCFHHRNPEEKYMEVSTMIGCFNKERILKEIEKCDVLCLNCHAKEEDVKKASQALSDVLG